MFEFQNKYTTFAVRNQTNSYVMSTRLGLYF